MPKFNSQPEKDGAKRLSDPTRGAPYRQNNEVLPDYANAVAIIDNGRAIHLSRINVSPVCPCSLFHVSINGVI